MWLTRFGILNESDVRSLHRVVESSAYDCCAPKESTALACNSYFLTGLAVARSSPWSCGNITVQVRSEIGRNDRHCSSALIGQ